MDIRFPVDGIDILKVIGDAQLAVCDIDYSETIDFGWHRLEAKRENTQKLLSTYKSVGALSSVDGCVVFDRNMVMHGFGASIKRKEAASRKPLKNIDGNAIEVDTYFRKHGERHKSAYELCCHQDGAIAFVASQDGGLKVIYSNEDTVYLAEHLQL